MKLEDVIPLCGTSSALPGNLALYPADAKWNKLLVGVVDRNHLLLTSIVPGELHGMKEIFLKDKLATEKAGVQDTTILKAHWCKMANASFLVLCSSSGFQIFEEEGSQVVFTYSFKDDDSVDEAKWEYAASVAHVNNLIFIGSSSGFFYIVSVSIVKEKGAVFCTANVIRYLRGHTTCITAIQPVTDKTVVSGDASGKISVWKNLPDLQKVVSFAGGQSPVTGLVCWNYLIVAAFGNGSLDVIDALNLVLLARVSAHGRWISGLDVAPETGIISTCGEDGIINSWKLSSKKGTDVISHVDHMRIPNALFMGVKFLDPAGKKLCVSIYDKSELPVISL